LFFRFIYGIIVIKLNNLGFGSRISNFVEICGTLMN
jgi:hypothetical protein